jgi:predicted TIM-barrel fold metal-dependent hydrolase
MEKMMSSLIEVLKVIQERDDLESRTEARKVFDTESTAFEKEMDEAYNSPDFRGEITQLASAQPVMAEYWMNQWVGSDPQWHGDWGRELRRAVKEVKAGAEVDEQGEDEAAAEAVLDAVAEMAEPESVPVLVPQSGTVKAGRFAFPATRNLETGAVTYKTKYATKTATDRIAATFQPS